MLTHTEIENLAECTIENPQQPKCALVLVLDTSGSMGSHDKIGQLNQGLASLKDALLKDNLASQRVELTVVSFNSTVQVDQAFQAPVEFLPPTLQATGTTALGQALNTAFDLVYERLKTYKKSGSAAYTPWVFLVTDADSGGMDMQVDDPLWNTVKARIQEGKDNKFFTFFAVGVEPADMNLLGRLVPCDPKPLQMQQGSVAWEQMFTWLSNSMSKVSGSRPGDQVGLPPVSGWASVTV